MTFIAENCNKSTKLQYINLIAINKKNNNK